ncbi:MAG TPA: DUF483 domain-containing protein, partial [Thermoproteales archaeon]|nr:DUF483 domain-containing protein [Thermoproteales archaeon]
MSFKILEDFHPQQVCNFFAVTEGIKPASIIESVEVRAWDSFLKIAKEYNLALGYESSKGFIVIYDKNLLINIGENSIINREYINACPPPLTDDGIDVHDVYIARDLDILIELIQAYKTKFPGRDVKLGKLLGYPPCCVENYSKLGPLNAWYKFQQELIRRGLDQKMPIEYWVCYHVPCSLTCSKTIELGRKYLKAVKKNSLKLYEKVINELSSSHLAYSVGRRFLDFKTLDKKPSKEVLSKISRFLSQPFQIEVGYILRPFSYFTWSQDKYMIIFTKDVEGVKTIVYKEGETTLVLDEKRVYLYTSREILSEKSKKYSSTAFRVYRTKTSSIS